MRKYDIPDQVESWEDLEARYTKQEIVEMCNQYLRARVRAGLTRKAQKAELEAFRAWRRGQQG